MKRGKYNNKKVRIFRGKRINEPKDSTRESIKRINRALITLVTKVSIDLKGKDSDNEKDVKRIVNESFEKNKDKFLDASHEESVRVSKAIKAKTTKEAQDNIDYLVSLATGAYTGDKKIRILKDLFAAGKSEGQIQRELDKLVIASIKERVKLIKKLSRRVKKKLFKVIEKSYKAGNSPYAEIQEFLDSIKAKPYSGIKAIVTDQGNSLSSNVAKYTLTGSGFHYYEWLETYLAKVPRESHIKLSGTIQDWRDPPRSGDAGEKMNPGEPYNCHCEAIPIIMIDDRGHVVR